MAGDRFKSPIVTAMARRQLFDGPTLTHVVSPIKAGQSILASPQKPVVQSPTSKYLIFYYIHTVIYPKYSKLILLTSTMDCGSNEMLNYGLNHGLFLRLFKYLGWKYILNWTENSGLKSGLLCSLGFYVLCFCTSFFQNMQSYNPMRMFSSSLKLVVPKEPGVCHYFAEKSTIW